MSALYRLGLPIFNKEGPCEACGNPSSDIYGDHSFSCGVSGERIARHNFLRDAFFQTAQAANLAPRKEERALGDQSRPGDVILPAYTSGRDTLFDVTVINAMRQDLCAHCAEKSKVAVGHAFSTKWSKLGRNAFRKSFVLCPYLWTL